VQILQYALLGLLQGLTEFLPVSSKSHLLLAQHWLGLDPPGVVVEVALHVATLLSVLIVYRRDIARIFLDRDWPYIGKILLASAVTAALILPFKDQLEALAQGPRVVLLTGCLLLVTAAWLLLAEFRLRRDTPAKSLSWGGAALIGLAQGIAILPGISRSGATIGTAIQLGEEWRAGARFSFLLSIPAIAGAAAFKADELTSSIGSGAVDKVGLAVGFTVALLAGIGAIYLLLAMLKSARLYHFSIYCMLLGLAAIISSLR
jgi:undecaprenyl-diphosphatase